MGPIYINIDKVCELRNTAVEARKKVKKTHFIIDSIISEIKSYEIATDSIKSELRKLSEKTSNIEDKILSISSVVKKGTDFYLQTEKNLCSKEFTNYFLNAVEVHDIELIKTNAEQELNNQVTLKLQSLFSVLKGCDNVKQQMDEIIFFFNSIKKDIKQIKSYTEWINGDMISFPTQILSSLDFIDQIDKCNKLVNGSYSYFNGLINGDEDKIINGGKLLIDYTMSISADALMASNPEPLSKITLSFGKHAVSNLYESLMRGDDPYELKFHTLGYSALETFDDIVCNKATLAIAYKPAVLISAFIGIDLQSEYEKSSGGEKGLKAVFDTFSDAKDLIMENATWKNWKSGMGQICEEVADWFSGLFD